MTLKSWLRVTQDHWKWHSLETAPHNRSHMSSYSSFIVTTAVPRTIFEIKRDIGRNTPLVYTTLVLDKINKGIEGDSDNSGGLVCLVPAHPGCPGKKPLNGSCSCCYS